MNDELVRIYSGEHGAYWRPNGHGYTNDRRDAWVLPKLQARKITYHCGPEKMIRLEPVVDGDVPETLESYLTRQWAWSERTFGPGRRTLGILTHIRKELEEIVDNPTDLSEWIDVIMIATDGFLRHGGTITGFLPALLDKQRKNFARKWPEHRPEERSRGAREVSEQEAYARAERLIEKVYESNEGSDLVMNYMDRNGVNSLCVLTAVSYRDALQEIENLWPRIKGKIVVEIGAGVGMLAIQMAKFAKRVYAIEADPTWAWVFTDALYALKPANLIYIFGRAQEIVGLIKADVAVIYTNSDVGGMAKLAAEFAPGVIRGPLVPFADRMIADPEDIAFAEPTAELGPNHLTLEKAALMAAHEAKWTQVDLAHRMLALRPGTALTSAQATISLLLRNGKIHKGDDLIMGIIYMTPFSFSSKIFARDAFFS